MIAIGDFSTEETLLDPLADTVRQFLRLLVPDDQLRSIKVRGLEELTKFWKVNHAAYSHVILIAHGDKDRMTFAADESVTVKEMQSAFENVDGTRKTFISLSCRTGHEAFGSRFSQSSVCKEFIGPLDDVHGALASQFCQLFFTAHLLEGRTVKSAISGARKATVGAKGFRLWCNGKLDEDLTDD